MSESIEIPPDVLACPKGAYAFVAWAKLRRFAAYMAARFNAPVLLVGSALRKANPRDIDVRIVIDDAQFAARYGIVSEQWERDGPSQEWIDDMGKLCAEESRGQLLNIDFQVYPERHARRYAAQPRVLLAAPSVPVFPSPDRSPALRIWPAFGKAA